MKLLTLAALAAVSQVAQVAAIDAWHLDMAVPISNEELDPVITPNLQAKHMHKIFGKRRHSETR